MKYLFIGIPVALLVTVLFTLSILQGCISFLWRFKSSDFFYGTRWLNSKIRWTRLVGK